MERLASAILIQAVKDWQSNNSQPEIRQFLASSWFVELVEAAGFEESQAPALRAQLELGTFNQVSLRAAYR